MSTAGLELSPPVRRCEDERCPFHGHLKVHGRLLTGKVVSIVGKSFVVIQMEYLHKIRKFSRSERRRSRLTAHLPPCLDVKEGDMATIAECRPLSKSISFVVVESRRSA